MVLQVVPVNSMCILHRFETVLVKIQFPFSLNLFSLIVVVNQLMLRLFSFDYTCCQRHFGILVVLFG